MEKAFKNNKLSTMHLGVEIGCPLELFQAALDCI